jgi:hypothetical protein
MATEAYVKILLDDAGELIGAERAGTFYPASEITKYKVPKKCKEGWSLKLMKIWHNSPCCVQIGTKEVCWPPCI